MTVWAIIVAGGSGSRFGRPKQYDDLGGRPVVEWACATARAICDAVVLVVPELLPPPSGTAEGLVDRTVTGGASRSASVRCGLGAVPSDVDIIVVHDAARPLASADLFRAVVAAVEHGADAAIPAIPVTDTIKRRRAGGGLETLERETLVAVQTPQAFRAAALRAAHDGGQDATDDAALIERCGGTVALVTGSPRNLKITEPSDLVVAAALLAEDREGESRGGQR